MSLRVRLLFALVMISAAARLLLQVAAMPPYAGLDEIYHVARIVFVMNEGRNPLVDEKSVPPFVHDSLAAKPGSLPDFSHLHREWPALVRGSYALPPQKPLLGAEQSEYPSVNYESQQPSIYYWIAALPARLLPQQTPLALLRLWRLQSVVFSLITVAAMALFGYRLFGAAGMLPALLLPHLPTWQTLVTRASNDALPCALLAIALFVTSGGEARARIAEGLAWALALTVKLYTWPALALMPVVWWWQRASRARIVLVSVCCAAAMLLTVLEVRSRTGKALGLFAFDEPQEQRVATPVPIDYASVVKITVASGIWMSGQHNNALTVAAMAAYVLPLLFIVAWIFMRNPPRERSARLWLFTTAVVLAAFFCAQIVNLAGFIRQARAAGSSLPLGGKEGWYWYVLAPLVLTVLAGWFFRVAPRFAFLFVIAWAFSWDVVIAEGALFRDYAGLTSPATASQWFRWGPAPVFGAGLRDALLRVAVGPLTGAIVWLRAIDLAAVIAAVIVSRSAAASPADTGAVPLPPHA